MEPLNILHIEDEPLDSELVRARLEHEGLRVNLERVHEMGAFQAALASGRHALVLSAYRLAALDALAALRWARVHYPEMPFIIVSGVLGEESAIQTLQQGATDYVLKQHLERLGPAVRRALQETQERMRHRQAEAELRAHEEQEASRRQEAEQHLRLAIEAAALGTFDHQPQSGQLIWSERTKRHFGLSPNATVSYDLFLRGLHPEDRERVHQLVQSVLRPEQGGRLRTEYRTIGIEDGQERWLEVLGQTYFDEQGRPLRVAGITRDITQRKQAEATLQQAREELARANAELEQRVRERTAQLQATIAELEQMSYSMVHDLRAPLRAILSFGGLVADEPANQLTPESRQMIDKMRTAAARMDHLVRDVLNYGRVVREELPLSPVEVGPLVRGIVETYPNLYSSAAQVQIAGHFPLVLGNPAALTQCLSQLLSNAVKFTRPGQPPRIQVWGEPADAGWVRLVVADNGIGIAPQLQAKVFGLFQQLRNTHEGTGMGLAIVKKAVERMGGRVGVDSTPGAGSRFWLQLQAATPLAEELRKGEPREKAA